MKEMSLKVFCHFDQVLKRAHVMPITAASLSAIKNKARKV